MNCKKWIGIEIISVCKQSGDIAQEENFECIFNPYSDWYQSDSIDK